MHIRCLQQLLYEIQKWPGIGQKSAQKFIVHLLKNKDTDISALIKALDNVMNSIKKCPQCFGWIDNEKNCFVCDNPSRNSNVLCIVENPFDIFRVENSMVFQGHYHVLHGLISPLQNISPEDLTIHTLLKRIQAQSFKEIILALDTNLEGDTTCLFLVKKLKPFGVKISRLASGIPLGSDLDFVDDRTLSQAIENRKEM